MRIFLIKDIHYIQQRIVRLYLWTNFLSIEYLIEKMSKLFFLMILSLVGLLALTGVNANSQCWENEDTQGCLNKWCHAIQGYYCCKGYRCYSGVLDSGHCIKE
ncbi:uncharacterized protein LOC130678409 [Microplitis mediator]|uniref:uncharacterized protein LOC130678409 n=1 Tax=Microplitis mediator TaxID=375433 RepID=UPI0025566F99|nr:uncharacterized protein LOC130678409 [Microplitis mediator]